MDGSLRSPRVRLFLAAEAASAVGTWATFIAIWGYAAFEFDATAADVTLFGVMLTLPGVLLGPIVGTLVDRLGPKLALALAKAIGVAASLALLVADDFRTLAVLSMVHGIAGALTIPALQSLPPRIVGDSELARANALVSLADEFAIVGGPVVAGFAIGWFGFRGAFVIDAGTYLLGILVLPLVRVRPPAPGADGEFVPPASFRDAFDGLRLVVRTPALRHVVVAMSAVHLLYGAAVLAEPLYVRDVLERSPAVFAALQAVFGVFLVVGGIVVARQGERLAVFRVVAFGLAGSGVTAAIYLATPFVSVAFVGVSLWGVFTALLSGPSRTLLQRNSPEHVHGRVMATDSMAATAAQLLGILSAGALVSSFGVPTTVLVLGTLVVAVAGRLHLGERRTAGAGPRPASPTPIA